MLAGYRVEHRRARGPGLHDRRRLRRLRLGRVRGRVGLLRRHAVARLLSHDRSGARPVAHWDATFDEALSAGPPAKTWTMHVGESFLDVPTSQQFYAFIENIFHNGITGGCGGGNYCPVSSTTRAQMAAFLLKAKHGAAYVPPGCTGIFADVPCPSLYGAWIEELAAEGITGGCGGGNYCPGNPVTRAQMSAFLLKAKYGASFVPPVCTGIFSDVPCPSPFADWIEELFAEAITGGCGAGDRTARRARTIAGRWRSSSSRPLRCGSTARRREPLSTGSRSARGSSARRAAEGRWDRARTRRTVCCSPRAQIHHPFGSESLRSEATWPPQRRQYARRTEIPGADARSIRPSPLRRNSSGVISFGSSMGGTATVGPAPRNRL